MGCFTTRQPHNEATFQACLKTAMTNDDPYEVLRAIYREFEDDPYVVNAYRQIMSLSHHEELPPDKTLAMLAVGLCHLLRKSYQDYMQLAESLSTPFFPASPAVNASPQEVMTADFLKMLAMARHNERMAGIMKHGRIQENLDGRT